MKGDVSNISGNIDDCLKDYKRDDIIDIEELIKLN